MWDLAKLSHCNYQFNTGYLFKEIFLLVNLHSQWIIYLKHDHLQYFQQNVSLVTNFAWNIIMCKCPGTIFSLYISENINISVLEIDGVRLQQSPFDVVFLVLCQGSWKFNIKLDNQISLFQWVFGQRHTFTGNYFCITRSAKYKKLIVELLNGIPSYTMVISIAKYNTTW